MSHRMELAHPRTQEHKVMVRRSNNSTCGVSFLVGRDYSWGGTLEKMRLSVQPLCWRSVQTGRSFKGQLKSPPIIMGPVHDWAAVKLGLKFISSLLVEYATCTLKGGRIGVHRNTKDFQGLSLNSTHGESSFVSVNAIFLSNIIGPQGKTRNNCGTSRSR